jgi:hypothetical protein
MLVFERFLWARGIDLVRLYDDARECERCEYMRQLYQLGFIEFHRLSCTCTAVAYCIWCCSSSRGCIHSVHSVQCSQQALFFISTSRLLNHVLQNTNAKLDF